MKYDVPLIPQCSDFNKAELIRELMHEFGGSYVITYRYLSWGSPVINFMRRTDPLKGNTDIRFHDYGDIRTIGIELKERFRKFDERKQKGEEPDYWLAYARHQGGK